MTATHRGAAPCAALAFLLLAALAPGDAWGLQRLSTDMSSLPDEQGWERIGGSHAVLLENGYVAINDNSQAERIAFEAWSGEIAQSDELRVRARVFVVSNLEGHAVTVEIARPGLEVILRLYPDHVVLVERDGSEYRWLASHDVDLSGFTELELIKKASVADEVESIELLVAGSSVFTVTPAGTGSLGVSRVIVGSLSYADMGASIWDWIELERRETGGFVQIETRSLGSIKALFDAP